MFLLDKAANDFAIDILTKNGFSKNGKDKELFFRLSNSIDTIAELFGKVYGQSEKANFFFERLILQLAKASQERAKDLKERDSEKKKKGIWFLSNELTGMSLYVDRFSGDLKSMNSKLDYLEELGVNFLHLMPLFESPENESDGGYAVSNFRKVDKRFGSLDDLKKLRKEMQSKNMYLMLDIVLNHTSHQHEWAEKAKKGDPEFQDFYYMYDNKWIPNQYEATMPDIFPESSPGNFTW
ncbi:alpha-amylase family glycosyl hydrolase, partial [Algoriphagus sp.]|uniref:alpha-amylase family glycosyl hydrolase n=1 Tax=Algoriphagus sp. TaxID=1872435 RepID=UPI0025DDDE7D